MQAKRADTPSSPSEVWPSPAWQGRDSWCVLDDDFAQGLAFLQLWHTWQQRPQAPATLHYVGLSPVGPVAGRLRDAGQWPACLRALAEELAEQCFGLLPGLHRLVLARGRVHLTLWVGERESALQQLRLQADVIELRALIQTQNPLNTTKALSRLSRHGTSLTLHLGQAGATQGWLHALRTCGFAINSTVADQLQALYHPPWQLRPPPGLGRLTSSRPRRCAVVGAGLAGASVAAALARRGWLVSVFERASHPAAGSSGLPVGLLVPHVSKDDCSLSQLSRAGVRLTLGEAQRLLQAGQDWSPSGVCEQLDAADDPLPDGWPDACNDWCTLEPAPTGEAEQNQGASVLRHHRAGWLKPAALVQAWLHEPGITLHTQTAVQHVRSCPAGWQLQDEQGRLCFEGEHVVLANACAALDLLRAHGQDVPALAQLAPTVGQRGLLSWALHASHETQAWPEHPTNGSGSLLSHIPTSQGHAWFAGASYQDSREAERSDADNHAYNLAKLRRLDPAAARYFEDLMAQNKLQHWKGLRCTTRDHLPMAGLLQQSEQGSLWISAGMGSRGISLAMLCAELLAANMCQQPLPLPWRLARQLAPLRRKQSRQTPAGVAQ